jgi:hypothetical protein
MHVGTIIGGLCALENVLSLLIKLIIATMKTFVPKPAKTLKSVTRSHILTPSTPLTPLQLIISEI